MRSRRVCSPKRCSNSTSSLGPSPAKPRSFRRLWQQSGTLFRDRLVRVFVDVADTAENRHFFVEFKERLKTRFEQLDIWLTTHPVEVI